MGDRLKGKEIFTTLTDVICINHGRMCFKAWNDKFAHALDEHVFQVVSGLVRLEALLSLEIAIFKTVPLAAHAGVVVAARSAFSPCIVAVVEAANLFNSGI